MKKSLKAILLFFVATVVLSSCSDDDNPPTAGFSFSTTDPVQYDIVDVSSSAEKADDVEYNVAGGAYEMDGNSIQFLDATTYTVTQTATNGDGTDTNSQDIVVSAPVNTYKMTYHGDTEFSLTGDAYWFASGDGQIRIEGISTAGQETNNLCKIVPKMGADPVYGTGTRSYTWQGDTFAGKGDVGSYDAQYTHYPATGTVWDAAWMMSSTSGDGLTVTLVYDAENDDDNVYDIIMSNTAFSGYYDGTFSPQDGEGVLSLNYRGPIAPLAAE
ncbi:MAG: hypothetical protein ABFS12_15600 [Bacteroidota bacterium]